ncbi:unnamed protein product [Bursaphelenchus xylophilus]|uniref:(pine wood nematode) hypothetical protein n=1 Tax=Bursaphelenchus xylophilus TaxID=6326 RepID=A0A7I8WRS4_BURXY|nr:unnamed protein product [Bursaphelenchus xylophilus]CAG9114769.1 unnamed protein product [Bursaphelenchus xylophilus]
MMLELRFGEVEGPLVVRMTMEPLEFVDAVKVVGLLRVIREMPPGRRRIAKSLEDNAINKPSRFKWSEEENAGE